MKLHVYETRVYEVEVEDPKDGWEIGAKIHQLQGYATSGGSSWFHKSGWATPWKSCKHLTERRTIERVHPLPPPRAKEYCLSCLRNFSERECKEYGFGEGDQPDTCPTCGGRIEPVRDA